jgi:hypothetical protein
VKVKELKALLDKIDPEALLVVESSDHSYRQARPFSTWAVKSGGDLSEDYYDETTDLEAHGFPKGSVRIPVLVVQ